MIEKPRISVIVPIYQNEKYLRQCVDSLCDQTLREIQIILVDDGSPDSCPQICDMYANQDERVQVIHKKNGGLLHARISGVNFATAKYIGFVDGDDFVAPQTFETLVRVAAEHDAQLVCSSFWMYWNEERKEKFKWDFPAGLFSDNRLELEFYPLWFENRKEAKPGLLKAMWCKLFDRILLKSVYACVPQEDILWEDLITSYAVAAQAERIVILPETALYYYRQVEGSIMNSYWRDFLKKQTDVLTFLEQMPYRDAASPFIRNGLSRLRAYALQDILYNECKSNKTSTKAERAAMIETFLNDKMWREAAKLDILPRDNQTARLFRQLLIHRQRHLLQAAIQLATLKNRLIGGM